MPEIQNEDPVSRLSQIEKNRSYTMVFPLKSHTKSRCLSALRATFTLLAAGRLYLRMNSCDITDATPFSPAMAVRRAV